LGSGRLAVHASPTHCRTRPLQVNTLALVPAERERPPVG